MSVATSSYAAARSAGRSVDWLLERPRTVVGTLIVAQFVGTLLLAVSATHNGWVYFQGGDQIMNTTTGWLVGRLELPPTDVTYIWPLVQAPITWLTGPTYVQALPLIVLLQVLVLGPIALLCVYGIASQIGGRLLGYWASALWVIAPFVAIPLFVDRYHEKWIDQFLPQALGLTAMPDYPSMVLVLAAALFVARSLGQTGFREVLLAGVLAGAAGGLKPANYLFAAGAVLAYPVARRWREALVFAAPVAASVLVVAFWKERGLGYLPALTLEQARLAAGAGTLALDVNVDRYIELDFDHWRDLMGQLRENFFSARVAQFAPIAGVLAVIRVRKGAIAALLAGWLAAFVVVKGFSPRTTIEGNTFWRLLMPAWPAYLLLFASIPLLVPTLARRLAERVRAPRTVPVARRWVITAAVVTLAVPVVATAASDRMTPPTPAIAQPTETVATILTPVDEEIELRASSEDGSTRLTWTPGSWNAEVFYRVYRTDGPSDDTECELAEGVSWTCSLVSSPIATTRDPVFIDTSPAEDGATYRIGVGTNWVDDPAQGDIFAFSPPVPVVP